MILLCQVPPWSAMSRIFDRCLPECFPEAMNFRSGLDQRNSTRRTADFYSVVNYAAPWDEAALLIVVLIRLSVR